jgi:DNA polymerase-3 subunit alpha
MTEAEALKIWRLIEPFAAYGFNKAHGSSYALIAYQTAYVKANYPFAYMSALLTCESGNMEKIAEGIAECEKLGIKALPPDINESLSNFTVVNKHCIRFGLGAIKHLSSTTMEEIIQNRKSKGHYQTLEDFLIRVESINKKSLEALVRAGALDRFAERSVLDCHIDTMLEFAKSTRQEKKSHMEPLFKDSHTRRIAFSPPPPAHRYPLMAYEKEYLGLYISAHPLDAIKPFFKQLNTTPIAEIKNDTVSEGQKLAIAGIAHTIKTIRTRRGDAMLFVKMQDFTGMIEVIVFPRILETHKALLKEDALLLVEGTVSAIEETVNLIAVAIHELQPEKLKKTIITPPAESDHPLYLTLPQKISKQKLHDLKGLMQKHPGGVPVYLRIDGNHDKIVATNMKVSLNTSFNEEMQAILYAA